MPEQVADDVSVAGIVYRSLLVSLFRIIDIYTEYYSIVFVSWVFLYFILFFIYVERNFKLTKQPGHYVFFFLLLLCMT